MILICLNPFESHFIPTLPIAENIKCNNEKVAYIGFPHLKDAVEAQGYEYTLIEECTDETIQKLKREHKYDELETAFKSIHSELEKKIATLKPDMILFHISRFDIFFLPIHSLGISYMTYDMSFGKVNFSLNLPPSTSSIVPIGFWDFRAAFAWWSRLIRKVKELRWFELRTKYPYAEINKVKENEKLKWRFCIDGFYLNGPHIKFAPGQIEFRKESKVYYAGLCVKNEDTRDEKFALKIAGKQFIYCSLGTMSNRYMKAKEFLNCLIKVMRRHPEISLMISLGRKNETLLSEDVSPNITIIDYINQREILKEADLVITHGGAGTIKECIYYEVPMIVVPSSYDQAGNAAKVCYHKIGVRNRLMKKSFMERRLNRSLKKMNEFYLEKQILEVINNKTYKENIAALHKKIEEDNESKLLTNYLYNLRK